MALKTLKQRTAAARRLAFGVGASTYHASITRGRIVDDGGGCLAVCLQSSREILIAGDTPLEDRLRVLLCEVARAWTFEIGTPADVDGWLRLASTVARGALLDLARQGGPARLLKLKPL
jgi:hypothetical protein